MTESLRQALYNNYYLEELWKEYLFHKTKKNYELFVLVGKALREDAKDMRNKK